MVFEISNPSIDELAQPINLRSHEVTKSDVTLLNYSLSFTICNADFMFAH